MPKIYLTSKVSVCDVYGYYDQVNSNYGMFSGDRESFNIS